MPVLAKDEVETLSIHVSDKVKRTIEPVQPERVEALGGWLRCRFVAELELNARAAPRFGGAATAIGVIIIGAGLASTTIAGATDERWSTFVIGGLGILVGVLGAINQIWRPGARSVSRYHAAFGLRREGWDYLNDQARYEGLKPMEQLAIFIREVGRAHLVVEAVEETTLTSDPNPSG
jgi:hypothetical protein